MLIAEIRVQIEEIEGADLDDTQMTAIGDALAERDWDDVVSDDLEMKLPPKLFAQISVTLKG